MAVSFNVASTDRVGFITIDDGVTKDMRGLRYVEDNRVPVTAFVSAWTVKDRARYFQRITRWGSVQNHSATHASMARSSTDLDHEICYTQRALARSFGAKPWMLRPPYGAGYSRQETQLTAARCGISDIVMWDAVVEDGRLTEVGNGLRPGAIVLLHFTPRLEKDLRAAVRALRKAGLAPADLADYLPPPSGASAP
jgi:peptidoglycan/xylan/chitin deacetylase (PgdA/CDA1 family)